MKVSKKVLATAMGSLLAFGVNADVPNTFVSGEAALASEVNENFTSLDQRIAALEDKLGVNKTYAEMLSDNTYSGQWIDFGYAEGSSPVNLRFAKAGGTLSLTFNSDGTISDDTGSETDIEGLTTSYCTAVSIETGECTGVYTHDINKESENWTIQTSTWAVDNATGIVTVTWEGNAGDTTDFRLSDDASIMYALELIDEVDNGDRYIDHTVVILARE